MTRYRYRTVDCPDCFEGRYERAEGPGYVSCRCEECDGTGETDQPCSECGHIEPLNDEGECERCHDKHELPVAEFDRKYGLTDIEHLGPGRIAA